MGPPADLRLATLRREAPLHGGGFWLRPHAGGIGRRSGLAALYQWEVGCNGLLPAGFSITPTSSRQFLAHAALIALMLAPR